MPESPSVWLPDQIYVLPSATLLEAFTVYDVEPFDTTNLTAVRDLSVIALKVTFEFLGAELGEAYTKRIAAGEVT